MTILATVYASAPADEVVIPTIELTSAGWTEPVRVCMGYEDITTDVGTFTATAMEVALPERNTQGYQSLRFAIANVSGQAQRLIDDADETGDPIELIYRVYLASDLTAPAEQPKRFLVREVTFNNQGAVQVSAAYKDLINRAWPRVRYTADFAPGLKYS